MLFLSTRPLGQNSINFKIKIVMTVSKFIVTEVSAIKLGKYKNCHVRIESPVHV